MYSAFAHSIFIAPYQRGWENLKEAVTGKKYHKSDLAVQQVAQEKFSSELSPIKGGDRFSAFIAGTLLMIPIINTITILVALHFDHEEKESGHPF